MLSGLIAQHMSPGEKLTEAGTRLGLTKYEIDAFIEENQGDIWSTAFNMLDAWREKQGGDDTSTLQEKLLELLEPAERHDVTTKLQLLTSGLKIRSSQVLLPMGVLMPVSRELGLPLKINRDLGLVSN